jgi:hypothetical protein
MDKSSSMGTGSPNLGCGKNARNANRVGETGDNDEHTARIQVMRYARDTTSFPPSCGPRRQPAVSRGEDRLSHFDGADYDTPLGVSLVSRWCFTVSARRIV